MAKYDGPPDQGLFEKYELKGFPTVLFLDSGGKRLFEFRPDSEDLTRDAVSDARVLMASAGGASASASKVGAACRTIVEAFRGVREVSDADLAAAAATPGLDRRLRERYDDYLVKKPFHVVLEGFQKAIEKAMKGGDREAAMQAQKDVATELLDLFHQGKKYPADGTIEYLQVWNMVFEGAMEAKDKQAAAAALAALEKAPQAKQFGSFIDQLHQRLDALGESAKK